MGFSFCYFLISHYNTGFKMENLPSKKAVDEFKKFGRGQPHELDFIGLDFDLSEGKREHK
jgi:hypothetical protein